jgi:hypothetical protein
MQLRSSMHWLTMKLATLVQLSVICITRSPICASCEKNRKKGSPVHVDPACAESGGGSHHSGSYKYIPHLLLLNSNPLYGEHLFLNFYISKMQLRSSMHWHRMKLMTLARSLVICTTRPPIRVSCEKKQEKFEINFIEQRLPSLRISFYDKFLLRLHVPLITFDYYASFSIPISLLRAMVLFY